MPRATRLSQIAIHDGTNGLELEGPSKALVQLARMIPGELNGSEIALDDGSVLAFRVTDGPLVVSYAGQRVDVAGSREALGHLAHLFRFVAEGPQTPSEVRYHAHVEHFPGHLWLAAKSVPMVITLA